MYDPMAPKKPDDAGYIVAWKYKYQFETGKFSDQMTYAEAKQKAAELNAKEPEKAFWAEKVMELKKHG